MAQVAAIGAQGNEIFTAVPDTAVCIRMSAGLFRRMDCHDEIATGHCDYSPAAGRDIAGTIDMVRCTPKRSSISVAIGCCATHTGGTGYRAAGDTDCTRRLGQQQLRSSGLPGFSAVSRCAITANGFRKWLLVMAQSGHDRQRRLSAIPCADRDPLDASRLRLYRGYAGCLGGT